MELVVTKFDQLPDLCLRKVFAFLSLPDLVKCRAVNRQFKHYADRTQVTELVATCSSRYIFLPPDQSDNWYRTDRPIGFNDRISPKAFASAKSSTFKLDQQLKFLYVDLKSSAAYEVLNSLTQLIHLEVHLKVYPYYSLLNGTGTLALPSLKVLVINSPASLVLKTPKLEVLKCKSMARIRFEYPETIKRAECDNLGEEYGDLATLKNLEVLRVVLGSEGLLEGIRLSDFPSLKELHLRVLNLPGIHEHNDEDFRTWFLDMMIERSVLQRDELKLYLNDVLMVDAKQLPTLRVLLGPIIADDEELKDDVIDEAKHRFMFMNYRRLLHDSYPDVTSVNFRLLVRLDFEISEDFFIRFPRIQELTATDPVDREQFEWFLQNATELRVLKLFETRLDQDFADHLPTLCSRLTCLEFYESSGLVTNFDFVLRFQQLEMFETDRPLPSFLLASAAFRQLGWLKSLQFRTGNSFVKIKRYNGADEYTLQFIGIARNKETTKTFKTFRSNHLTWAQLTALYDLRKSDLIDEPEKMMRIKRARLE